ncbi:MAG: hypothetical protein F6K30_09020 [Cyanothece sp. SIO2G6]|nr:hypothetical protein [Cyanothece sp. SIO2G6]
MATIAFDLIGTDNQNLNRFTVTTTGGADPVSWSPGDWFGVAAWGLWPQPAGVPFALADDSVEGISGSVFAPDSQGIIDSSTLPTDLFFGSVDLVNGANPGGSATATWEFDVSGFEKLSLSIDMAAMGDFEASGDSYVWSYSIDGGAFQDIFVSSVDEAGAQIYTMENGLVVTLDDPLLFNNTILDDEFQTLTETIEGSGSTLTLQLTGTADGGSEAYVAQNIVITGGVGAPVINEVLASHTGPDNTEYFELFGAPGTSLEGLSLIVVEGEGTGAGTIDERVDFGTGDAIGTNGFFLVGNAEGLLLNYGVTPNIDIDLNFENGDETFALVETSSLAGGIGTQVTGNEVVVDSAALTEPTGDGTFFFDAPIVGPDGSFFPAGARRVTDGVDTDSADDFVFANFFLSADNTPTAGTDPQATVINEVLVSHTGVDNTEFFEIFGTPGTSLAGLSFVAVDAGTGEYEFQFDFADDAVLGDNGFYLVGNPEGLSANYGVTPDAVPVSNSLQNNSATYALVETASLPGGVGTAVSGNEVVLDAVASTDPTDVATGNFVFDAPVIGPDGTFLPAGVRRVEDGVDTDAAADFVIGNFFLSQDNTPTAAGGGIVLPDPIDATIMDIQGSGLASDLDGVLVRTTGIVTAVDTNGFYFQDAVGDGDEATSDGLFVFTGSTPTVAVGDGIEVIGNVLEFGGGSNLSLTQIALPSSVTVLSSDNVLPAPVVLGNGGRAIPTDSVASGIDFYESLEGMLVTLEDAAVVSPTDGNEIYALANQGVNSDSLSLRGTINNGPEDFNPERVLIQVDSGVTPNFTIPDVNVGDTLGDVTGVVNYSGGEYEVEVTQPFTATAAGLESEVTELVAGEGQLTVASYNVLNLDPGDGAARFAALGEQIVNNLGSPDIIGLQEIQDNNGAIDDGTVSASETLRLLAEAVAEAGGPVYEVIDNTFIFDGLNGGQPGGNIRAAFLYNPERVSLVEESIQPGALLPQNDPNSPFNGGRLPLSATFTFEGEDVTVVNNHFSSKGGSVPLFGSVQPTDLGQEDPSINGSLNERREQAQAVNDFVDTLFAADPDANVVVLGDLNEFEFVSPLDILDGTAVSTNNGFGFEATGDDAILQNLVETLPENERYTFIFQGNSQTLDHILVSNNLAMDAEVDIVFVNTEFVEEVSDHEPLVARLDLGGPVIPVLEVGLFDADTNELITLIEDGTEILASDIANRSVTIAASVSEASELFGAVGSMELDFNNGQEVQVENIEPYALFGDRRGNFNGLKDLLATGENTIEFDIFSERQLQGDLLDTVSRTFSVVDDIPDTPVDGFALEVGLYNTITDELIAPLQNGSIISVGDLANGNITIAAFVVGDTEVGSVELDLNNGAVVQTENVEPYALFGDRSGDFNDGTIALGQNTIEFEVYSESRLRGDLLGTTSLDFTLVESALV